MKTYGVQLAVDIHAFIDYDGDADELAEGLKQGKLIKHLEGIQMISVEDVLEVRLDNDSEVLSIEPGPERRQFKDIWAFCSLCNEPAEEIGLAKWQCKDHPEAPVKVMKWEEWEAGKKIND